MPIAQESSNASNLIVSILKGLEDISNWLWGFPLLYLLIGGGRYLGGLEVIAPPKILKKIAEMGKRLEKIGRFCRKIAQFQFIGKNNSAKSTNYLTYRIMLFVNEDFLCEINFFLLTFSQLLRNKKNVHLKKSCQVVRMYLLVTWS